jgi:hypothetical protein
MAITITLSSYNMGDATEQDYDAWVEYVREHICASCDLQDVDVNQAPFGAGIDETISGADNEQQETISSWLAVDGWVDFCNK